MSTTEIGAINAQLTAITTELDVLRQSHKMDIDKRTGQLNQEWFALRQKLDELQRADR